MEPKVGHYNACRYPSAQIEYKSILILMVCSIGDYCGFKKQLIKIDHRSERIFLTLSFNPT